LLVKSIQEITEEAFAKLRYAIEHDCSATLDDLECRAVVFVFDIAVKTAEDLSRKVPK